MPRGVPAPSSVSGDTALAFDIRTDLRGLLAALKEVDPKLATSIRRRMRRAGDSAIASMRQILDDYPGGTVTGKTYGRGADSRGRKQRLVQSVSTTSARRSRSSGAREQVKRGLKFRVTAGKTRTTVRLTSTNGALRNALNRKHSWRHPVYKTDVWVEQPGAAYFSRGGYGQMSQMKKDLELAILDGLAAIDGRTFGSSE